MVILFAPKKSEDSIFITFYLTRKNIFQIIYFIHIYSSSWTTGSNKLFGLIVLSPLVLINMSFDFCPKSKIHKNKQT